MQIAIGYIQGVSLAPGLHEAIDTISHLLSPWLLSTYRIQPLHDVHSVVRCCLVLYGRYVVALLKDFIHTSSSYVCLALSSRETQHYIVRAHMAELLLPCCFSSMGHAHPTSTTRDSQQSTWRERPIISSAQRSLKPPFASSRGQCKRLVFPWPFPRQG